MKHLLFIPLLLILISCDPDDNKPEKIDFWGAVQERHELLLKFDMINDIEFSEDFKLFRCLQLETVTYFDRSGGGLETTESVGMIGQRQDDYSYDETAAGLVYKENNEWIYYGYAQETAYYPDDPDNFYLDQYECKYSMIRLHKSNNSNNDLVELNLRNDFPTTDVHDADHHPDIYNSKIAISAYNTEDFDGNVPHSWLIVWDYKNNTVKNVDLGMGNIYFQKWSKNGKYLGLVVKRSGQSILHVFDMQDVTLENSFECLGFDFSPDEDYVALRRESSIEIYSIEEGIRDKTIPTEAVTQDDIAGYEGATVWAPNGGLIAVFAMPGSSTRVQTYDQDGVMVTDSWSNGGYPFAWTPDSRTLFINRFTDGVIWEME